MTQVGQAHPSLGVEGRGLRRKRRVAGRSDAERVILAHVVVRGVHGVVRVARVDVVQDPASPVVGMLHKMIGIKQRVKRSVFVLF